MSSCDRLLLRFAFALIGASALTPACAPGGDAPRKEGRDQPYLFRLQAAKQIADESSRVQALLGVAKDAAEQAVASVVEQCVAALPDPQKAGAIAQLAPLLAECGQETAALKMTESIADAKARDAVLAALAKGSPSGMTPLMRAASRGFTDLVRELLDRKADVNEASVKPIRILRTENYPLALPNTSHSANLQKGTTALMLAAAGGHTEAVQVLLEKGADVNAKSEPHKLTALMLACMQGHKKTVELLLRQDKLDLLSRSKTVIIGVGGSLTREYSAFQWAVVGNHPDLVALLLDKGALTNEALSYAKTNRRDIAQLIETQQPRKALTGEEMLKEAWKAILQEDRQKIRGLWEAPGKLFLLGEGVSGTSVVVTVLDEKGAIAKVGSYVWGGFKEKNGKRSFELLKDGGGSFEIEYVWNDDRLQLAGGVVLQGGQGLLLAGEWRRAKK